MKTILFYVALLVVSLWSFNANAFYYGHGEKFERLYYNFVIEWEEQHRHEFTAEETEECVGLTGVGREAILMRDEGLTLEFALEDLHNSLKELEEEYGGKIDKPLPQEFERMLRTVFRYPNMGAEEYNQQFMAECQYLEGYR